MVAAFGCASKNKQSVAAGQSASVNPFVTGTSLLDDEQWSNYHGLQLEQYLQVPSTPGQVGSYIVLYANPLVSHDMSLTKVVPVTERLKFTLQAEALNVFNHPVQNVGAGTTGTGTGGTINIDSLTFGQTSSALVAARQIQLRGHLTW